MNDSVVLHISPFFAPNIGGVETHLSDLITKLDSLGYRNLVLTYSPITTTDTKWKSEEKLGRRSFVRRFNWFGFNLFYRLEKRPLANFLYITPYLLFRSIFWLIIHRQHIVNIHSHGINGAIIGIILKKIFRIPNHIVSVYSSYDNVPVGNVSGRLVALILNLADKVLAQSRRSAKQLGGMGVEADRIGVYHHWINLKQFRPMNKLELRRRFNIPNKFSVIFIGRMIPQKGATLLAKVAVRLPQMNFLFVGKGPDYPIIEKLSKTSKNIILLGNVPYGQLHIYYNLADLLCIPSLYDEGWGRVILEALACGLPVIASNRGAISEVVDESVAIIIEPTVENIRSSIKKLYGDDKSFRRLQGNSVKFAHLNFSSRSINLISKYYL